MKNQNYTATIEIASTPKAVFESINDVSKWWATPAYKGTFEGKSTNLNDEFVVKFGDAHYSKQKLIEFIPDKKIGWLVTDSELNWLKNDKNEWTGTKMFFELTPKGDHTVLGFTHEGLVAEVECYNNCVKGWDMLIKEGLYNYIADKFNNTENQQDFSHSLTVKATPAQAMEKISQVDKWWAKNFKGSAAKLNDEFSVHFGDTFVNFRISELIPEKKITWLVTDCNLSWIKDKKEWKDTEVIFTLSNMGETTRIDFVHMGISPESECYETCSPGWMHHLNDSLQKLIDNGEGFPE